MDRLEIYNNGETKVEIEGWLHEYLKSVIIRTIKLSPIQYRFLLEVVLDKLNEQNIDYKGCKLKASSKIPVLEHYKIPSLIEPFDIFDFAITSIVSMRDWKYLEELVGLITQHYKRENIPFYMELFKNPVYKADGFIVAKCKKELLISFFALDNEEREENIREID